MKQRLILLGLFAAAVGACGGNYSNEDIDFQLAVPQREDLAIQLPATAEAPDAAEHYKNTRNVVKTLNGIADAFISLVDHVRAAPPSQRAPGHRVWGPFPVAAGLWEVRMVVDRPDPAQLQFVYSVDFHSRVDTAAPWGALFTGQFAPNPMGGRGDGAFHFSAAAARTAGYPLLDLAGVDTLDIEYSTLTVPRHIHIELTNFPAEQKAAYDYQETPDGAGAMLFQFPTPGGGALVMSLEIRSRWLATGAGRADVTVLTGLATGMKGVDCWGVDTRATYVHRDWDQALDRGDVSTCVFPAP